MATISIFLADDHQLMVDIWKTVFNQNQQFNLLGTSNNGNDALAQILQLKPDIALIDVSMPGLSGIALTERLSKAAIHTRVIGISMHTDPVIVLQMLENGAKGYLTKNAPFEEVVTAIHQVFQGDNYISVDVKSLLDDPNVNAEKLIIQAFKELTPREIEIIHAIRKGKSSADIAQEMFIYAKTVETHRYNIFKKLKVKNAVELINLADKYLI